MPIHLINENSPYLLQHANNPLDWFPWGEEALTKAQTENKPIFLSIGYAACHWCHVMAHESFEDAETAAFMNEHFIGASSAVHEFLGGRGLHFCITCCMMSYV
jgi:uncharacterized protein